MPGQVISRYRILSALGSGGMGVVYRAEDTELRRTVALKFLPERSAQDDRMLERFKQEARNASALNHPNICTIYEVGEADGEVFIAMEYVEGRSLAEQIRPGGLPPETVIRYGRQVAAALDHAHERGIIHRDLKCVNIVTTPQGDAKVLDFGLAKRMDEADLSHTTLVTASLETTLGLAGTLPYMAPELLEGKAATSRSDIWALGIVLFEMAAGRRPFEGENLYRLCGAILQQPAPPLPPRVPPGLAAVIRRCLEKEPARRYQRAGEVRAALEALDSASATDLPPAAVPRRRRWMAAAAAAAVAFALTGASLALLWPRLRPRFERHRVPAQIQLAVLPPAASGSDTAASAFDSGLTETLTARLTELTERHSLAVIPTSEVLARRVRTLDQAREQFGVNLGLALSVQRASQKIRVNYSLVDARTHQQLGGGTITAAADDPFVLQDQVAESVVKSLEIELLPQEVQSLGAHGTSEPAAFDYYLQGRGYLQDFGKLENVDSAISVFQQALQKDPGFALAIAGLGEAYWRKYDLQHDTQWAGRALEACERAVGLRENQAAGHACLGQVYLGTGEYEKAAGQFQRAVQLEPTSDAAYSGLAKAYESLDRPAEAEKTFQKAIALRPNYWAGYNWLGNFHLRHGRLPEAWRMFTQVISLAPDSFIGYSNLGSTRVLEGRYADAVPLLEHSIAIRATGPARSNLATAYFQMRRYADAARNYEAAVQLDPQSYQLWGNLGDAYYWAPGQRDKCPGAYRKAIALAEEKLAVNPRDAAVLGYLSGYHAMLGEEKAARETLGRALKIAHGNPEVLLSAAIVYLQFRDTGHALEALESAVANGLPASLLRDLPNFDSLRENPRFLRMIPKAGS